jgi:hypothetical protein
VDESVNDLRYGATVGERVRSIRFWQRVVNSLSGGAAVLTVWGLIYPHPGILLVGMLAVWPWILLAVVAGSQGVLHIHEKPVIPRPDIHLRLFIAPLLPLWIRASAEYDLWDIFGPVPAMASIAGTLVVLALIVDRDLRERGVDVLWLALIALFYGYRVAMEANCMLDRTPFVGSTSTVVAIHNADRKRFTCHLELRPPVQRPNVSGIEVRGDFCRQVREGDRVRVADHAGALGIGWYQAELVGK